jgi:transcriptional regulator with XRE-family HTH domain
LQKRECQAKDLALAVDVKAVSISNIVQGNSLPKPDLLLKIAQTLDTDLRELFNSTKEKKYF